MASLDVNFSSKRVEDDRSIAIDAALVRIMKVRANCFFFVTFISHLSLSLIIIIIIIIIVIIIILFYLFGVSLTQPTRCDISFFSSTAGPKGANPYAISGGGTLSTILFPPATQGGKTKDWKPDWPRIFVSRWRAK